MSRYLVKVKRGAQYRTVGRDLKPVVDFEDGHLFNLENTHKALETLRARGIQCHCRTESNWTSMLNPPPLDNNEAHKPGGE